MNSRYLLNTSRWIGILAALAFGLCTSAKAEDSRVSNTQSIYVGTYTQGDSEGIYRLEFDGDTGALTLKGLAVAVENPSFLARHPRLPVLYAVGESAGGEEAPGGKVFAYRIQQDGALELLSEQPSGGDHPCHLSVSPKAEELAVANYSSGSVGILSLDDKGLLAGASRLIKHHGSSVVQGRQDAPHAHSVDYDLSGRFLISADLGIDQVITYSLGADSVVTSATLPAGSGPRHLVFDRSGGFVYVVNELNSTVSAYSFNAVSGKLDEIQHVSTLPDGYKDANHPAEIALHPTGNYVYASNRGHDSIVTFAVDKRSGKLTLAGHTPTGGQTPRHFALDPSGRFLLAANQGSNDIHVFRVSEDTGVPQAMGINLSVPSPVCLLFVP